MLAFCGSGAVNREIDKQEINGSYRDVSDVTGDSWFCSFLGGFSAKLIGRRAATNARDQTQKMMSLQSGRLFIPDRVTRIGKTTAANQSLMATRYI